MAYPEWEENHLKLIASKMLGALEAIVEGRDSQGWQDATMSAALRQMGRDAIAAAKKAGIR